MMAQHRLVIALVIGLLSACQRGGPPPPVAGAPTARALAERLQHLGPWLDTEADVLSFADLPAIIASPAATTWLEAAQRSPSLPTYFAHPEIISGRADLAAFAMRMPDPPRDLWQRAQRKETGAPWHHVARYVLVHTVVDPNEILTLLADAARVAGDPLHEERDADGLRLTDPAHGFAIGRVNGRLLIGGNHAGLQQASRTHTAHALSDAGHTRDLIPSSPALTGTGRYQVSSDPLLAWGRVRCTPAVSAVFPAAWHAITAIDLVIRGTDQLQIAARFHFPDAPSATTFGALLEGMRAMGTVSAREAPWLTPLLHSLIVRADVATVHVAFTLFPEHAMQIAGSGCHLISTLHWHAGDVALLSLVVALGALWLWRRDRC